MSSKKSSTVLNVWLLQTKITAISPTDKKITTLHQLDKLFVRASRTRFKRCERNNDNHMVCNDKEISISRDSDHRDSDQVPKPILSSTTTS